MGSIPAATTPTTLEKEKTLNLDGYIVHETDRSKVAYNEFSDEVPVISLAGLEDDSPGGRKSTILYEVAKASEEWGIFQLVDHGIDVELIDKMRIYSKEFFGLTDEEKLQFRMSPGNHKGGFGISSHMQEEAVANWRELMLFFTHPVQGRDYSRWPNKPVEWKSTIEAYSQKTMDLSIKVLELLSESLGLEKDALAKSLVDVNQHLVVNHYPRCPLADLAIGLKRHRDPTSITLLLQDHVGGLQVTKDDGKTWITVRPINNAIVVNLGDHVYYMSNGKLKSADHRATVNSKESRMSIATFTLPAQEAKVYPLNLNVGEKSVLEEPITYAEMNYKHKIKYLETVRLKSLAKQENWTQQQLDFKLSQLRF